MGEFPATKAWRNILLDFPDLKNGRRFRNVRKTMETILYTVMKARKRVVLCRMLLQQ
jgi:hypothetical protein